MSNYADDLYKIWQSAAFKAGDTITVLESMKADPKYANNEELQDLLSEVKKLQTSSVKSGSASAVKNYYRNRVKQFLQNTFPNFDSGYKPRASALKFNLDDHLVSEEESPKKIEFERKPEPKPEPVQHAEPASGPESEPTTEQPRPALLEEEEKAPEPEPGPKKSSKVEALKTIVERIKSEKEEESRFPTVTSEELDKVFAETGRPEKKELYDDLKHIAEAEAVQASAERFAGTADQTFEPPVDQILISNPEDTGENTLGRTNVQGVGGDAVDNVENNSAEPISAESSFTGSLAGAALGLTTSATVATARVASSAIRLGAKGVRKVIRSTGSAVASSASSVASSAASAAGSIAGPVLDAASGSMLGPNAEMPIIGPLPEDRSVVQPEVSAEVPQVAADSTPEEPPGPGAPSQVLPQESNNKNLNLFSDRTIKTVPKYHLFAIKQFFYSDVEPDWDPVLENNVRNYKLTKDEINEHIDETIKAFGPDIHVYRRKSDGDIQELIEVMELQFCDKRLLATGPRYKMGLINLGQLAQGQQVGQQQAAGQNATSTGQLSTANPFNAPVASESNPISNTPALALTRAKLLKKYYEDKLVQDYNNNPYDDYGHPLTSAATTAWQQQIAYQKAHAKPNHAKPKDLTGGLYSTAIYNPPANKEVMKAFVMADNTKSDKRKIIRRNIK